MRKIAVEILCEIKDENSNSTNLLNKNAKNILETKAAALASERKETPHE